MYKRAVKIIATVLLCGMGAIQLGALASAANSGNINFSAELLPSTTVTIPTNPVGVNITPSSAGAFGSTSFNVTVSTNQPGYTLSMTTSSTSLASTTINPETNEYFTIPTLDFVSGGYTESTFTRNRWGISIDGGNYNAITASQQLKDTSVATNADTTTIGVGANLDLLTASGSYSTTIEFTVVPKVVAPTINSLSNMQDFAALSSSDLASIKGSMSAGTQYSLKDTRDNKTYNISKIGDTIWMTSNLNVAGGTTLTSEKTNIVSDYTLPASALGGFADSANTAYVYNDDTTYGGYYSYAAATAGTNPSSGESVYDICPKGWHLPSKANYDALLSTYATGATLTTAPWYGMYGGYAFGQSIDEVGDVGTYWTSTVDDEENVYIMDFQDSSASTKSDYMGFGNNIRCIAK